MIRIIAEPGLLGQAAQQLEDLGLDRDVEGRRRLVGDHQLGLERERHGDHHALAHPAGELVREVVEARLRLRDADHLQQLDRPGAGLVRG